MPGGLKGPASQPDGGLTPMDLVLHHHHTPPCPAAAAGSTDSSPLWSQIQNLGLFPIHGVMMKITIPIATRGGNRLLMLKDFLPDQVPAPSGACSREGPVGDRPTPRAVPESSDLSSSSPAPGQQGLLGAAEVSGASLGGRAGQGWW